MPKLIDVLKTVAGKVNSNELSAALSASEPWNVEIDQSEFEKTANQIKGMLTLDSAVNNPDVAKQLKDKLKTEWESERGGELKSSIYGTVEEKLGKLSEKLGVDLSGKRLDEQIQTIGEAKFKSTGSNEELKKLQEQLRGAKERETTLEKEYNKKFTDFKIDTSLRNKLNSLPLAQPYQEAMVKDGIFDKVISTVKNKANLKLSENGDFELFQKDNPEMELYGENNKKLGIDDIINPLVQPFIKTKADDTESKRKAPTEIPAGEGANSASDIVRGARAQGVKY
jgi:hypothetical protein